ncbi:MAG: hypothetical protein C0611_08040, partial [Desulfobacteraceae bacterium]
MESVLYASVFWKLSFLGTVFFLFYPYFFTHRRDAKDAENLFSLFSAERAKTKKIQAFRAIP